MIDESELEDFRAALREHGYTENDFELSEQKDPLPSQGITPVTGTVTVRNKKSGIEHTYESGHGTAWVVAFAEDLKAHRF